MKSEQLEGLAICKWVMGEGVGEKKRKKRKKENGPLHWPLVWTEGDWLRLKEMGLGKKKWAWKV